MTTPKNLVWETTSQTSSPFTLTTVARSFNNAYGTGGTDLFTAFMYNRAVPGEWMVFTGHLSASTTMVVDTVIDGSNGTSAVAWSAGTKDVTSDVPAQNLREVLSANRSYYVSTTGSDSNTGLTVGTGSTVTFTNGSSNVGWTSHGRSAGDCIILSTGGALPSNFRTAHIYYVKTVVDANTITLSETNGGTAITAGSAGSGTHTATLLSPFLTIQKAIDTSAALDLSIYNVTINVGGGTYTAQATLKSLVGSGSVSLIGDTVTWSNVVINPTAPADAAISANAVRGVYSISGFRLATTTSGYLIHLVGSTLQFDSIDFAASGGGYPQLYIEALSKITATGNYSISGGAQYHMFVRFAYADTNSRTVTLTGTPAFSAFYAYCESSGSYQAYSMTFSGSATGTRYNVVLNGSIFVNGGGASYFPGNAAGSTATGGQYV